MKLATFKNLTEVASHLRKKLEDKKYVLLFAYNGTGKTRLSMEFKDLGKNDDERDTLYFNAFTEDLFYWDNDLESDTNRELRLNASSRFFSGLLGTAIEIKIRKLLHCYADFDFKIKEKHIKINNGEQTVNQLVTYVSFERNVLVEEKSETIDDLKVSRGEENLFIWCFFLVVAQMALDKDSAYKWVKYIYIDDPISSLDDNNAIAVASHLGQLLKGSNGEVKTVISSHHSLFFNVMCNELKNAVKYMLCSHDGSVKYSLKDTNDTPFFYHVAILKLLLKVAKRNKLYTYHFSMLRNVMEKAATFHGFNNLSDFIKRDSDDPDSVVHHRIIQLLNHGGYSHFEPQEMNEDNKQHFKNILNKFISDYEFNPVLIPEQEKQLTENN